MLGRCRHGADRAIAWRGKERNQRGERCAHAPAWLPLLRVVAADGKADLGVDFKPARRGEHHEAGRFEGIVVRQDDPAVIDARLVIGIVRPPNGKVPLEYVALKRFRGELRFAFASIGFLNLCHLFDLLLDPLHGGTAGIVGGHLNAYKGSTGDRGFEYPRKMRGQR